MALAQKPDFVFWRNGPVHLNRRGRQFIRLLATEVCASAVVMLDTPCSEVLTGYPLHSQVSISLPLPCVTVCHHISTGLYHIFPPVPAFFTATGLACLYTYPTHHEPDLFKGRMNSSNAWTATGTTPGTFNRAVRGGVASQFFIRFDVRDHISRLLASDTWQQCQH